uniref:Zinc finger protein 541 n=1 Tax=Ascaris suum TaxID=6253 RepID=F1KSA1_ASCSU
MFTSSQHDSSALIDNYPAANYHPSMQNNNRTEPRSTFQESSGMTANEPCSSMMPQAIVMNQTNYQGDMYSSSTDYTDNNMLSPPFPQQMNSSPANAYNSQRIDGCNDRGQQVEQYGAPGYCASDNISRQHFDFPAGLSLPDMPPTISDTRQQHRELNSILSFDSPEDDIIQKELSQMPFPDSGDPFAPGPSHVDSNANALATGSTLGPLEIDVSVGDMLDGMNGERRRHRTDPGLVHRISAFAHGAPISDLGSGCSSSDPTNNVERLAPISAPSNHTSDCSPLNNPIRMHRKSKGKPENVCQLLASMEQRSSFDADSRAVRKGSTIGMLQKKSRNGMSRSKEQRGRSISINVAEFRRKSFVAAAFNRFSSQLRSPRFFDAAQNALQQVAPYTPPPMLSPKRSGSGLFWQLARSITQATEVSPSTSQAFVPPDNIATQGDAVVKSEVDDEPAGKRARVDSVSATTSGKRSLVEEPNTPLRKNGFCYATQLNTNLLDIEALRKESSSSKASVRSLSHIADATSVSTENALRKPSSISTDGGILRKISSLSDSYEEECIPPESDATPHINRGKDYQAKVKKWADREITDEEREAIPDRDDAVFDCNLIDHLESSTVEAYELLACSQAVPRPGRNRELALHLLMENKGNIQAAVMDLMRSDTLDWEQYPIIYNNIYNDTDPWTPEDIQSFQDAIYKSEKDFHQVSLDLGNKTVKQCVEFYYMWKKACPDDYRKLRNLRRKRQLLEMHQQMEPGETYNLRSNTRNMDGEEDSETSEAESDATNPSYATDPEQLFQDERADKVAMVNINESAVSAVRKTSAIAFVEPNEATNVVKLSPNVITESPVTLTQPNLPQRTAHPPVHRAAVKKGAQPSADGYFHCRLCDKCFEKVKSLNAHMKSHAMKARAEAEAQAQMSLQFNAQQQAAAAVVGNAVREKPVASTNTNVVVPNVTTSAHQNALAQSPLARVAQNLSQNPFSALGQPTIAQDLFVQTSLAGDQLAQSTLMQSPLGPASLAAHSALGQSLTAASVLSQLPQAQALHFLNTLHHPTITH